MVSPAYVLEVLSEEMVFSPEDSTESTGFRRPDNELDRVFDKGPNFFIEAWIGSTTRKSKGSFSFESVLDSFETSESVAFSASLIGPGITSPQYGNSIKGPAFAGLLGRRLFNVASFVLAAEMALSKPVDIEFARLVRIALPALAKDDASPNTKPGIFATAL